MKNLIKSSVLIGGTELAVVLVNIIRSKYLAITIGPDGLGLYSLFNSFFLLISAFCGGWFSLAYIKFVAEFYRKKNTKAIQSIHNFSFSITCFSVFLSVVLLSVFKDYVKITFLSKEILDFHYAVFLAVFVVNSFKSLFEYYLNATLLYHETARSKILTTLFEFFSILILVYLFHITGFFISLFLSALISLIVFSTATGKFIKTKFDIKSFNKPESNNLLKFGSFNILLLLINSISQYFYRIIVLSHLNIAAVGLFHAVNSLVGYLGIFNKGTNFSYNPIMGQDLTNVERNKALDEYLRLNVHLGVIVSSSAILFCDKVIFLFYSAEFNRISEFSHVFIVAQFLSMIVVSLQAIVVGTNNYRVHSLVVFGTNCIWIAVPILFISQIGIKSIGLGMILASIWSIAFNYIYLKKRFELTISRDVKLGFCMAACFIFLSVYMKDVNWLFKLILLSVEAFLISTQIQKADRLKLYSKAKVIFKVPK